tara:strand:- start:129 stop:479 length:351 start_codon:yes stop_codon:yes gene_type:complete
MIENNKVYNLKNILLKENKIDKDFLNKIQFLKLEELITLKLISSTKSLGGKLYNFPILKYCDDICKEAVLRYALSICNTKREASLILGMKKADLLEYIRRYNLTEEFKDVSKMQTS